MRATRRLWVGSPTLQKASPAGYFIYLYFLEAVSVPYPFSSKAKLQVTAAKVRHEGELEARCHRQVSPKIPGQGSGLFEFRAW